MDIRAEVVVAKPIQEVFEGWSQVERYPEWFGTPIYLDLRVRVKKNWSRSERMLRELGFDRR